MSKIISIIGGNGYVGKRCIKTLLNSCRDVKIYSISRNIELSDMSKYDERVEMIKGDALEPEKLSPYLEKSEGIIDTVGKLLPHDIKNVDKDYEKMNFETAISIARKADSLSALTKRNKNFVYISAERGVIFPLSLALNGYINSKRKAEEKLIKDFPNLNTIILRPGIISDIQDRPYLLPLNLAFDTANFVEKNLINKFLPDIGEKLNLPAGSIPLDVLAFYAASGALGKLNMQIYSNDYMKNLSNMEKIRLDL